MLLHPFPPFSAILNLLIFFSCPEQRTPFFLLFFAPTHNFFSIYSLSVHSCYLLPSYSAFFLSSTSSDGSSSNHHSLLFSCLHHSFLLPHKFFLLIFTPTIPPRPSPHPTLACDEERYTLSSSLHKWREEGVRIWGEEEEEGGGGGGLLGEIHFQSAIFSFVFLPHFTAISEEENREEKKENYIHTHTHTHTEKRPRWPSLIKGIFQERLTSLSTMLRQDTFNSQPPPQQTAATKGRFVSLPERKSITIPSKCHPN